MLLRGALAFALCLDVEVLASSIQLSVLTLIHSTNIRQPHPNPTPHPITAVSRTSAAGFTGHGRSTATQLARPLTWNVPTPPLLPSAPLPAPEAHDAQPSTTQACLHCPRAPWSLPAARSAQGPGLRACTLVRRIPKYSHFQCYCNCRHC